MVAAKGVVAGLAVALVLSVLATSALGLDRLPLDYDELKLRHPLSSSPVASAELRTFATKLSANLRQDAHFDVNFVRELSGFVTNNKSDVSALTAKLYLALYLTLSSKEYQGDKTALQLLESGAETLYSDIASGFPGTWEGKLASVYNSDLFLAQRGNDKHKLIIQARQAVPVLTSIEKDPGFIEFQKVVGSTEPLELSVRSQIVRWQVELGELQAAEEEVRTLRQKYPASKSVDRLERRVSEARKPVNKP